MSDDSYTWDDWLSGYAEQARETEQRMKESRNDVFEFRLTRWGMPDFQKGYEAIDE